MARGLRRSNRLVPEVFRVIYDIISRWIMRSKEAGTVLQIPLLGITAISTLTTALKGTPLEQFTLHIMGSFGVFAIGFIWWYDDSGVLNRQQRDRMDRADNFAGPGIAMNNLIQARQFAALSKALAEDTSPEEIEEAIEATTVESLREFRGGIDIERIYGDMDVPPQSRTQRPAVADGGDHESDR